MLYAQVYYFHSFTQHFSTPLMSLFEVAELTRLLSYCSIFLLVHSYIQSSMCLYYKYLLYWIDCNYFCLILTLKVDISTWLFFICCYSVLLFCCWYISKHIHYYLLKNHTCCFIISFHSWMSLLWMIVETVESQS
jgi:hypothetical protein